MREWGLTLIQPVPASLYGGIVRPMVLKWVYENVSIWSRWEKDNVEAIENSQNRCGWIVPPKAMRDYFLQHGDAIKADCGYRFTTVTMDVCNAAWRQILKMRKEPWYKEYKQARIPEIPIFLYKRDKLTKWDL